MNGRSNGVASGRLRSTSRYACTLANETHLLVQGSVRSRKYEREGAKLRSFEVRADTIAKLDRVERRQDDNQGRCW